MSSNAKTREINKNANKMNAKQKLKAVPTVTYQQRKNHTQRLNEKTQKANQDHH